MADVQILYRYFLESGGYPKDIRGFATGLAEKFDVRIVCFPSKSGGREEFEAACDVEELDALSILRQLLFKETPKIHYVLSLAQSCQRYTFIAFFKKKIILIPLGQLMPQSFEASFAYNIPEQESLQGRFFYLRSAVNKVLKDFYFLSVGRLCLRLTTYLGSFSRNEFLEAQTLAGISSLRTRSFFLFIYCLITI